MRSFGYDAMNRLTSAPVTGGGTGALSYDPMDRLYNSAQLGVRLMWSGSQLIGEVPPGGGFSTRHVPGPNPDETTVSYAGLSFTTPSWPITDAQGSPIALTDATGAATQINTWDDYGRPASTNAGRFGYTGQLNLPGAGIQHYKARAYDPALGRFLQTDPVGYEQGLNLYAYVGNDPINATDPTGRTCTRNDDRRGYTCKVDDRGTMTDDELEAAERAYTRSVNRLLSRPGKRINVTISNGRGGTFSGSTTQREVADALINANVSYEEGDGERDASYEDTTNELTLHRGSISYGENASSAVFIHEGMHETRMDRDFEERFRRDRRFYEIFRDPHDVFNQSHQFVPGGPRGYTGAAITTFQNWNQP